MDNHNMGNPFFSGKSFFPADMWNLILNHLLEKDITNLRILSKNMASDSMKPVLLRDFLISLNKMGASINMTDLDTRDILPVIKEGFKRVNESQIQELTYLEKHHSSSHNYELCEAIRNTQKGFLKSFEMLEKRKFEIDRINTIIISYYVYKAIINGSTILDLSKSNITGIPESVILDHKNHDSLMRFEELSIATLQVNFLPAAISELKNLKRLQCHNSQLIAFPESIGQFKNLESIDCFNCQLTVLPESMTNLTNLKSFICANNKLQVLPQGLLDKGFKLGFQYTPEPIIFNKRKHAEAMLGNNDAVAESKEKKQKIADKKTEDQEENNEERCTIM